MSQKTPFFIQPLDHLGALTVLQEDVDFADTLGQSYRNRAEPDFMGTSISGARWKWAGIGMACIFLVLLGRSAQLQIWQG
ncbi:TPA: hypothetical protein DEB00_00415, partial [Candidatus Uhrbacteria bacterium]|nr:hypothetical protein [Candidatus Uhrbacteria bacterium]